MEKLMILLIGLCLSTNLLGQPSNGKDRHQNREVIEASINAKKKKVQQQPNNLMLYLQIAEAYIKIKEYEQATDWFSKAQKVQPQNAQVYYRRGVAQYLSGEITWAEAADDLMTATKKDREFHSPYIYLGRIYRLIGKPELAEHFLNQGLKIKSNDAELLTERAELYRSINQADKAIDDLIRAISQDSDFAPAYATLAQFYLDKNDLKKAVDYADQALSIAIDFAPALKVRAHAFLRSNQAKKACIDIEKLRLSGENVDEFETNCN